MYSVAQKKTQLKELVGVIVLKLCKNPNFDTLSSFLELDFIICNQKLFKISLFCLKK